jgi:hypothetical protein
MQSKEQTEKHSVSTGLREFEGIDFEAKEEERERMGWRRSRRLRVSMDGPSSSNSSSSAVASWY